MPLRFGFDQVSKSSDESKAKSSRFGPSQSFIHKQEIGLTFHGQRNRFRLARIKFALKGCHDVGIADVSTRDPVERLHFGGAGPAAALYRDFVINGPRNQDRAI
jgi:hypothetical protein